MVAKKASSTEATSTKDKRVDRIVGISPTEVLVIRTDDKEAFRCHPDDVTASLNAQDSGE